MADTGEGLLGPPTRLRGELRSPPGETGAAAVRKKELTEAWVPAAVF